MKYTCLLIALSFSVSICKAQENSMFPEKQYLSKFCAKFSLDEKPSIVADSNMIAIWNMQEDVDWHNYFVVERYQPNLFVFTYMNREGSNRTYEHVDACFSKIGNATFLNVGLYDREKNRPGYFFLKVTEQDKGGWHMTLSLVADTTLKDITSREALRERIAKNVDNPNFYKKPVHLHKKLPLMYCK